MITYQDKMIKISPRTKKNDKDNGSIGENEKDNKKQRTKISHNQFLDSKTRNNTNRQMNASQKEN